MRDADAYDLLVVGGGINGTGIARDAAGRGLRVLLCEQGDLAEHTSSASTKLIHGGLRYLEYGEFRLVREALAERERFLRVAPHIVWPLRFVLPHDRSMRPAWQLKLGLFLYDHLSHRRSLPGSASVELGDTDLGRPLQSRLRRGFAYSDCWVEDSRLVVLNAIDAAERGARIATRTRLETARRDGATTGWVADLRCVETGARARVRARALVNAAGPWVGEMLGRCIGRPAETRLRLVKGSHIVVRRLYPGPQAYILQQPDRRIVFAIPYEGAFTLIGTTDVPHEGPPGTVSASPEEVRYLCDCIGRSFSESVSPEDVVWSYAGLRPLYDDAAAEAAAVTRDYVLDVEAGDGIAPLLSVFGGKITTYRRLAEAVLARLARHLPIRGGAWTANAPLPGGDMAGADFETFLARLRHQRPFLPVGLAHRLARAYGTRVEQVLGGATTLDDLGETFEGGLSAREIDHLVQSEWARSPEDILWRRTKIGLRTSPGGADRLARYLGRQPA